ncbi:type VI secretion system baseplate subunit TssK [Sorangium sp. So ce1099]|uniref:type VI secretion system baseplate subunit TssK n=1 Tax=Sorangium sp. So ce1099 TaxID=3133331 RepID=UPI003F61F3FB
MGDLKIAFQRWSRGQVLEQEHFLAEEEAIVAHARLAAELQGLPFHGIGRLSWDREALRKHGKLRVTGLSAVTSGGVFLDLPGNATISDFDLVEAGSTSATLHLHLLRGTEAAPRSRPYDDDPADVIRSRYRLRLSLSAELDDTWESIPLGRFDQERLGGDWRLSRKLVPPLLQLGNNPYLDAWFDDLIVLLTRIEGDLEAQLRPPLHGGEPAASVRRCQCESARVCAIVREHREDGGVVHRHPYLMFDAVRAFYYQLASLYEARPELDVLYRHHDIAGCFERLLGLIRARAAGEEVRSPSLPFVPAGENVFMTSGGFSEELLAAREVYFVVQQGKQGKEVVDVDTLKLAKVDTLKLAEPGKLSEVNAHSLPGVTFKKIESPPPFRHTFGAQVDFYRIDTSSAAWRRVVASKDPALAYRADGPLSKRETALFWRGT